MTKPEAGVRDAIPASLLHRTIVPRSFYAGPPDMVAQGLLGKLLIRTVGPKRGKRTDRVHDAASRPSVDHALVGRIVEVEAYFGGADPAAHAYSGKTARNAVLFGPVGHAYVYFIYGMYSCVNVSCGPEGIAGCVLIRALEPLEGLEAMMRRRWPGAKGQSKRASGLTAGLTSGPGRLCQAFAITRAQDNGADFTSAQSTLQIQDDGFHADEILATPRIGIRKAADRLARYTLAGNPHISKVPSSRART